MFITKYDNNNNNNNTKDMNMVWHKW